MPSVLRRSSTLYFIAANGYLKLIFWIITPRINQNLHPEYLLKLNRGHWSCENNLNWVKDNVFFEDKSTISVGVSPLIMSLLRSLSIQIIKTISNKITETREMFNHTKSLLWKKIAILGCDF